MAIRAPDEANKDVLTNQKLSHLDSIEQQIENWFYSKREKEKVSKTQEERPSANDTRIWLYVSRSDCIEQQSENCFLFHKLHLKQLNRSTAHTMKVNNFNTRSLYYTYSIVFQHHLKGLGGGLFQTL